MFDNIRWYCLKKLSLALCWQECAVRPRAVASLDMPDTASNEPGSKVSDPQHSQRLLRVLRTFWQEQSFHDALLVVDGEELPVQKNILAAASPYIRSVSPAQIELFVNTSQGQQGRVQFDLVAVL